MEAISGWGNVPHEEGLEPAMGPVEAIGMLVGGGLTIKALAAGASRLFGRMLGRKVAGNIGSKIAGQMGRRGWSESSIDDVLNNPFTTRGATNRATGNRATAYYLRDGSYVVRDDVTGDVVQISDRFDPDWVPDRSIVDPYRPEQ